MADQPAVRLNRGLTPTRGKFITFEGIDGAGKSSHLDHVCDLVRARGGDPERTFEPGGTPFGQRLREVLLSQGASPLAEALAMFAARSAHVEVVIEPCLRAGRWIVCDRFTDSTYAYQCGGRGLDAAVVEALEAIVHPRLQPDATFLLDVDPAVASARRGQRERGTDKFESESSGFHARVRAAYLERARRFPRRIHLIDAGGTMDQVRAEVAAAFAKAFP